MSLGESWVDDFDGPAGDPPGDAWGYDLGGGGWGDDQLQHYTDERANSALTGDGALAITARREADGTITSARLITKDRFTLRYGRVEARIRVPANRGCWAAFWMLGSDIDDVGWPACGEIDVMEQVALDPRRVHGTLHGPGYSGIVGGVGGTAEFGADLAADVHRYAVEWTPSSIDWFLDGARYHRLTPADVPGPWPFDHPFYLLMNLAIGGGWPGNADVEPELPATMRVESVRVEPL